MKESRPSALSTIGETGLAYIKERGAYWRAEIRRKGYKPVANHLKSRGSRQFMQIVSRLTDPSTRKKTQQQYGVQQNKRGLINFENAGSFFDDRQQTT
jgi:hypothetical protein